MMMLDIAPSVQTALDQNQPLVALESTIISHGLPYPDNLAIARKLEDAVRAEGAIPATIAVIDGKAKIGLNDDDLERLASPERNIRKLSRRDLAQVMASQGDGATTVAATMILAEAAGICVFATGGIGGVHRNAKETFDISADLPELAQSNVAVVSAGPKAILDIGLTLEVLETSGVPILGYQTSEMPAFWSRSSGFPIEDNYQTPEDISKVMAVKWQSGLKGGVLIANPVPHEAEIPSAIITKAIDEALAAAEAQGIQGKEVTPFLLDYIRKITDGASLTTNTALVLNNARLAANIAKAYANLA